MLLNCVEDVCFHKSSFIACNEGTKSNRDFLREERHEVGVERRVVLGFRNMDKSGLMSSINFGFFFLIGSSIVSPEDSNLKSSRRGENFGSPKYTGSFSPFSKAADGWGPKVNLRFRVRGGTIL